MSMIGSYYRVSREKLDEMLRNPELMLEVIFRGEKEPNTLEIDKAWHGIHFLLTGHPWEGNPPLSYVVLGGQTLGDEDLGYGPPQYITPKQVKEVTQALTQLSLDELRLRYDADKFSEADIYPGIWDEEGEELDYLLDYLKEIICFFQQAADNDEAIIFWLN